MLSLRAATLDDAGPVAALAAELGYPASVEAYADRMRALLGNPSHLLVVAELDGEVIGWINVTRREALVSLNSYEIAGLVVTESTRGLGVGRALIAEGEKWALANGAHAMRVRSNAIRQEPHRFYPSLGYRLLKTQAVYVKELGT